VSIFPELHVQSLPNVWCMLPMVEARSSPAKQVKFAIYDCLVITMLHAGRDALRKDEPAGKWLSCVALLCQTFSRMRASDDRPLKLLVQPVSQVLRLCLSAEACSDELECAATQV